MTDPWKCSWTADVVAVALDGYRPMTARSGESDGEDPSAGESGSDERPVDERPVGESGCGDPFSTEPRMSGEFSADRSGLGSPNAGDAEQGHRPTADACLAHRDDCEICAEAVSQARRLDALIASMSVAETEVSDADASRWYGRVSEADVAETQVEGLRTVEEAWDPDAESSTATADSAPSGAGTSRRVLLWAAALIASVWGGWTVASHLALEPRSETELAVGDSNPAEPNGSQPTSGAVQGSGDSPNPDDPGSARLAGVTDSNVEGPPATAGDRRIHSEGLAIRVSNSVRSRMLAASSQGARSTAPDSSRLLADFNPFSTEASALCRLRVRTAQLALGLPRLPASAELAVAGAVWLELRCAELDRLAARASSDDHAFDAVAEQVWSMDPDVARLARVALRVQVSEARWLRRLSRFRRSGAPTTQGERLLRTAAVVGPGLRVDELLLRVATTSQDLGPQMARDLSAVERRPNRVRLLLGLWAGENKGSRQGAKRSASRGGSRLEDAAAWFVGQPEGAADSLLEVARFSRNGDVRQRALLALAVLRPERADLCQALRGFLERTASREDAVLAAFVLARVPTLSRSLDRPLMRREFLRCAVLAARQDAAAREWAPSLRADPAVRAVLDLGEPNPRQFAFLADRCRAVLARGGRVRSRVRHLSPESVLSR